MRAGDIFHPRVRVTVAGAAVTGLVTADFAVAGYIGTTTPGAAFTVTEEGLGWYRMDITSGGASGWHQYVVSSTGRIVSPDVFSGWLATQDYDTIFAAVVRPSATLGSTAVIASALQLDVIAYRYTPVDVSVTDQNDEPVDLSGYDNWRFTVRSKLHTEGVSPLYALSSGITGSALGVVSWAIPEDAAFSSQIAAAIAGGNDAVTLYYDMVADELATATKSRTVFRGQLVLHRYEGAAS